MSQESLTADNEKTDQKPVESLIYVGPNLPGSSLNKFTVFRNGMPTHLNKIFDECPDIERLFVPVSKLSEILEKITKTGTPYHVWYANVTIYATKGVK